MEIQVQFDFGVDRLSSSSCWSWASLHRDSTSREFAIQVGTPSRGSTQRMRTIYVAKTAMNQSQSGITFSSSLSDFAVSR
jgi:hypothetical protein